MACGGGESSGGSAVSTRWAVANARWRLALVERRNCGSDDSRHVGTRASSSTQYVNSPSVHALTSTGCQPEAHAWRTSANDSQRRCCANARRASSSSAHSATRSAWITSSAAGWLRRGHIASEGADYDGQPILSKQPQAQCGWRRSMQGPTAAARALAHPRSASLGSDSSSHSEALAKA